MNPYLQPEFGRRVAENNGGTDHGNRQPRDVVWNRFAKAVLLGKLPNLSQLDATQRQFKHTTDFRSVYATLLESLVIACHLQPLTTILGKNLRIDDLLVWSVLSLLPLSTPRSGPPDTPEAGLQKMVISHIQFEMQRPGHVEA